MTDNFGIIRNYLDVIGKLPLDNRKGNNDKHYVVEILKRGKDNPSEPAANRHIKEYYIACLSDLTKFEDEIKAICDVTNSRAYISVNWKSFTQITLDTIAEYARRIKVHDYKKPYSIWSKCSGKFVAAKDSKWVIDLDRQSWMTDELFQEYTKRVKDQIPSSVFIMEVPTRTGLHYVTLGFNRLIFETEFHEKVCYGELEHLKIDIPKPKELIHPNHITLLYENLNNDGKDGN